MTIRPSLIALVTALAAGCGGVTDITAETTALDGGVNDAEALPDARVDARTDAVSPIDARADVPADAPVDPLVDATRPDDFDAYHGPSCPDVPIDPPRIECDPYAPNARDCDRGLACFPYVQYPSGPCEQERYGTYCASAGTGVQGSPCSGGDCAAGFTCVISGSGVQCVKLCKLDRPNPCEDGLVCEPMDIPGFGGCL